MRLATVLACALALLGCTQKPKPRVVFVPSSNSMYWQTAHAGAVRAAQENGIELEWRATQSESSTAGQIAAAEKALDSRPNGFILAPVEGKEWEKLLGRIGAAQIPAAVIGPGLEVGRGIISVDTNETDGGRAAARKLGELLDGEGKVAILGSVKESRSTTARLAGFLMEVRASYPRLKVVQTLYGQANRGQARAAAEASLNANPDLRGVFADGTTNATAMTQTLRDRATTQVRVVAFDSNDAVIGELRDRFIDGVVVQDAFNMGYETLRALASGLRGQPVPTRVEGAFRVVDRANLETPQIVELLYPDIQRYLSPSER